MDEMALRSQIFGGQKHDLIEKTNCISGMTIKRAADQSKNKITYFNYKKRPQKIDGVSFLLS